MARKSNPKPEQKVKAPEVEVDQEVIPASQEEDLKQHPKFDKFKKQGSK